MKHFLTIFFLLGSFNSFSFEIDTVKISNQINLLTKYNNSDLDSAIIIKNELEEELENLENYPILSFTAANQIAVTYSISGDIVNSYKYFTKNLSVDTTKLDTKSIGSLYNNAGIINMDMGQFEAATKYLLIGLKYRLKLENRSDAGSSYNNLGLCYYRQDNEAKALEYYFKGTNIITHPIIVDTSLLSQIYGNIGLLFLELEKLDSAEKYLYLSNNYIKMVGSMFDQSALFSYFSELNLKKGEMNEAFMYNDSSLFYAKKTGDVSNYYLSLFDRAEILFQNNEMTDCKLYIDSTYTFFKNIDDKWQIRYIYDFYSDFHKKIGQHDLALAYKDSMIAINEALINEESIYKQQELEAVYDVEKKQILIDNLAKENELKNIKLEKENALNKAFLIGLSVTVILIIVIFFAYRQKSKANETIQVQKRIVEEKNKEITDSITYAKRIQSAILPSLDDFKNAFPNSLVIYKPKDIVAGDFYWLEKKQDSILFAVADCTGHGVPGALVSVVCNNALNRAVREFNLETPGEILDKTRDIVIGEFEKSEEDVKDGMDIALCRIQGMTLEYAAAYNPLWIIRGDEIIEYKANKEPIGKVDNPQPFSTVKIELKKDDLIYVFSDGYVDQFGGDKGKKFKAKSLRQLLLSIRDKNIKDQKQIINDTFSIWQGDIEQVDDVCIIGIRV